MHQFQKSFIFAWRICILKDLAQLLKGVGHEDNVKGEHLGMHNILTGEVFMYVYDPKLKQAKYNYSWGFKENKDKDEVAKRKAEIPVYDIYKGAFAACDHFNRNLKDKKWPYTRGGRITKGDKGKINDFFMACVLQNTMNAWYDITGTDHLTVDFKNLCLDLSTELYSYADMIPNDE